MCYGLSHLSYELTKSHFSCGPSTKKTTKQYTDRNLKFILRRKQTKYVLFLNIISTKILIKIFFEYWKFILLLCNWYAIVFFPLCTKRSFEIGASSIMCKDGKTSRCNGNWRMRHVVNRAQLRVWRQLYCLVSHPQVYFFITSGLALVKGILLTYLLFSVPTSILCTVYPLLSIIIKVNLPVNVLLSAFTL